MSRSRSHWLVLLAALASAVHAATPITTSPMRDLVVAIERSAPATVVAQNAPAIAAELTARITAIAVLVGARVDQGDILAHFDCRVYEARRTRAEAELTELEARRRFAASQLSRARNLKEQRNVSEETLDQRRSEVASLNAQIAAQRARIREIDIDVEHCTLRAPFQAVVVARTAAEGSLAAPGTPVVSLIQLDDLEVSAELRSNEDLVLDNTREFVFDYGGVRYPLRLRVLLPVVDERTRTRVVRLTFTGPSAPVGAAGRLVWKDGQRYLPAEYLVRRDGQLGIFLSEDGKARLLALPDAQEGQAVAVDLPGDTQIIVDGRQRVNNGDAITRGGKSTEREGAALSRAQQH